MIRLETGFTPQARQGAVGQQIADLQNRLTRVGQETATGRFADPAAELAGRTREALVTEDRLARLSTIMETIILSENRADAQQAALASVDEAIADVLEAAKTALSSGLETGLQTLGTSARQAVASAVGALNMTFAGRGLFSGDELGPALSQADAILTAAETAFSTGGTPQAGLEAVNAIFDTPGGDFDTSLYVGGTGSPPGVELDTGEALSMDLRADSPSIRSALRDLVAMSTVADPELSLSGSERRDLAENALDALRTSKDALATTLGEIGVAQSRIDDAATRISAEQTALTKALDGLTGRDKADAATEFANIQNQLDALFLTTSRIAQLSLSNYLR